LIGIIGEYSDYEDMKLSRKFVENNIYVLQVNIITDLIMVVVFCNMDTFERKTIKVRLHWTAK
jgi:hypothetical protein